MTLGTVVHLTSSDGQSFSAKCYKLLSASRSFIWASRGKLCLTRRHDIVFTDPDANAETIRLFLGLINTGTLDLEQDNLAVKSTYCLEALARLARFLVKYKCTVAMKQLTHTLKCSLIKDEVSNLTVYTVGAILEEEALVLSALSYVSGTWEHFGDKYVYTCGVACPTLCPATIPRVAMDNMPAAYFYALKSSWEAHGPGSPNPRRIRRGFDKRLNKAIASYPLPKLTIQDVRPVTPKTSQNEQRGPQNTPLSCNKELPDVYDEKVHRAESDSQSLPPYQL